MLQLRIDEFIPALLVASFLFIVIYDAPRPSHWRLFMDLEKGNGSDAVLISQSIDRLPTEFVNSHDYRKICDVGKKHVRRIVAVGDLHGDYLNTLKVLQMSGVVDASGGWTGNVDILVQTGDIIDGGDDTIKLFVWIEELRAQAYSVGGSVISLLGNHEWMNLLGDWRFVQPSEIQTFGSVRARQNMLQKGSIGEAWKRNYTLTSRVPLYPSMGPISQDYDPSTESSSTLSRAALSFVHAGLPPSYKHLTPYPSRLNELGARLLQRLLEREFPQPHPPHPPYPHHGLPDEATPEERSLYDEDGPIWYNDWALGDENEVCEKVDDVLQQIGVRRLIMGHIPNFNRIVSRCGGKVILIDTGISRTKGGILSALSINYTLTPHKDDNRRWAEQEVIMAIYPTRQEVLVNHHGEVIGEL